jgi:hypothetical protein
MFMMSGILVGVLLSGDLSMTNNANPDVAAVLKVVAKAPALPGPSGKIVHVAKPAELYEALASVPNGTTILIADGTYPVGDVKLRKDVVDVTIRGESGDREKVVIDCQDKFRMGLILCGARNVLIADLTIQNTKYGVFFYGDSDVDGLAVRNVKFHNIWVRGIKGTHPCRKGDRADDLYTRQQSEKIRPRNGRVQYCLFVNDHKKVDTDDGYNGDYIAGMDMMMLKHWTIADNAFIGIRGAGGGGRAGIFIWVESEDVVAERNVIINCDRGIAFGNPSSVPPHMTRGIVRNNFIVGGSIQALEFHQVVDCMAYNNTLYASDPANAWHVEVGHNSKGVKFYNNLVHGQTRFRDGQVDEKANIIGDLSGWFVDPATCDLHLTARGAPAFGKAVRLPEVPEDFNGRKRKSQPDIGADEWQGESSR